MTACQGLEGQLLQQQKMEALGELACGIAHDFNNQLTVISGFATLLERRVGEGDERAYLAQIQAAAARAAELTGQLLTFSRKTSDAGEVVDANVVADGVRDMLERLIDEDIRLEVQLGEAPAPVRIGRGQLEQVLVNLVVNARDAIGIRPGTIRIGT